MVRNLVLHRLGHKLGDGPLARTVDKGDVAKAGRAQALGVRDHAVEEAARLAGGPLDRNSAHDAPFGDGALEGLEGDRVARELLGEIDNLDGDTQIRLVRAVAQHRILVGQAREGRPGDGALGELREDAVHDRLQRFEHVLLLDEGHLDIELVELAGGAVGARVFVAEAGRNLEIAVEAGGHDQLLELLRRLRQRVEGARMEPARHQEVARALGRARGQDGRVALHEAQVHHVPANAGNDRAAPHHVLVHALAPEVEEAVAEPHLLPVVVFAVDRQRQSLGGVLHLQRGDADLDLAGRDLGIRRLLVARDHRAGHRHHGLGLERRHRVEERLTCLGDALGDAVVVAQVHEDEVTVIAHPMDPAGEAHGGADIGRPERAAGVGTKSMHGGRPSGV